jgi:hypothetical protein
MVELVAAPHLGPQHPPRRHVAGAMGRAAAVLLSALAIVFVVVSQGRGGVDAREGTVAERLQEVRATAEQRPASLLQGHYVSNGKVHYFQEAAASPPASAYFNPAADQPEYRAASTSGLGFAGGGDPYRYIRTGHYAKILAAEHDVEQGWSNGTTYHALGAMKAIQGRMQELAQLDGAGEHADIKTRDEAILALLSAPVSASELRYAASMIDAIYAWRCVLKSSLSRACALAAAGSKKHDFNLVRAGFLGVFKSVCNSTCCERRLCTGGTD